MIIQAKVTSNYVKTFIGKTKTGRDTQNDITIFFRPWENQNWQIRGTLLFECEMFSKKLI